MITAVTVLETKKVIPGDEEDLQSLLGIVSRVGLFPCPKDEALQLLKDELRMGIHYVLAVDQTKKKVFGFIAWRPDHRTSHGCIQLMHIGVAPDSQKEGLGEKLFKACITDAHEVYGQSIRKLWLMVGEDNDGAIKFYKRIGMEYETKLKRHLHPNKDQLIFSFFPKETENQ